MTLQQDIDAVIQAIADTGTPSWPVATAVAKIPVGRNVTRTLERSCPAGVNASQLLWQRKAGLAFGSLPRPEWLTVGVGSELATLVIAGASASVVLSRFGAWCTSEHKTPSAQLARRWRLALARDPAPAAAAGRRALRKSKWAADTPEALAAEQVYASYTRRLRGVDTAIQTLALTRLDALGRDDREELAGLVASEVRRLIAVQRLLEKS